ncbi:Tetratricopeptide repeat protein [Planctomycetes bacterium Poly30]|uniref:Tetratricopeptide repeat protein n=1 Tax=Saltatorellus ferox TaxID=2528018 RepID=A0A518ER26_9BACT|nr:Tetratricopeptide repeat protein [Planctomycetes bacterium Poly30]
MTLIRSLAPALLAAFTLCALSFGQTSPAEAPAATPAGVTEAVRALQNGDYVTAKKLIDRLLIADQMAATVSLREAGQSMEALEAADQALAVPSLSRAERAKLLEDRGRAAFAAAASDSGRAYLFEEALSNFEEAARTGAGVSAAFRASRAARMIGDHATALDLARAGAGWVQAAEERADGLGLDQLYTRTLAEAAFSSYLAAPRETEKEKAARAALFDETRVALEKTIGLAPTDTWAYRELSNLFLWEGRRQESLKALESALAVQPADEAVHTAFVKALGDDAEATARGNGADDAEALQARFDGIIGRYAAFRQIHPENALGYWYGGFEQFYDALNTFETGEGVATDFADAEALFRRCRELNPGYAGACVDFEVLCRNGQGWCAYQAENNEEAIRLFMSSNELRSLEEAQMSGRAAGMEVRLPRGDGTDRLPSALAGLDFVTRRFLADPNDVEALTRAAAIGDMMFELRPENANLANNAGFLNRDAAVLWERFRATDPDPAKAAAGRARAQELMERSYAAYQVAARLVPDDVRVVNDAGLIMTYYLRTDPEAAEAYLLDSVKDGEPQLADPNLGEAEREALNEAWGDAHQNLGILEMTLRDRPAEAKIWFEKALEIGPPSRNWLRSVLPVLDTWIETGEKPAEIETIEARTVWPHNPPRD